MAREVFVHDEVPKETNWCLTAALSTSLNSSPSNPYLVSTGSATLSRESRVLATGERHLLAERPGEQLGYGFRVVPVGWW